MTQHKTNPAGGYYDFTGDTPATLLDGLHVLAHDGLPTDSPHAQRVKAELTRLGVPLAVTDSLIAFCREVERAGR